MSIAPTTKPLIYAAIEQDSDVVSWVLQRCHNVSQAGTFDKTALHYAVERDEQRAIRLLLERGATTNVHDVGGWTPLVVAVQQQHVGAARILLGSDADRIQREFWGSTKALHWAVDNQHVAMVELLLQRGVDPDAVEHLHSQTPLMKALHKGNEELAHLFLRYGARAHIAVDEETAVMHAMRRGWESLVVQLLSKGLDIEFKDGAGRRCYRGQPWKRTPISCAYCWTIMPARTSGITKEVHHLPTHPSPVRLKWFVSWSNEGQR